MAKTVNWLIMQSILNDLMDCIISIYVLYSRISSIEEGIGRAGY